jgi:fibronectin-binding autotransporter adhesin
MGRKAINRLCARARLKQGAAMLALAVALPQAAWGASDISVGNTYQASNLGGSVNPIFSGGTLVLDSSTTITKDFTVTASTISTIDIQAHGVVFSGVIADPSSITSGTGGELDFTDTVGGGVVTLTGVNTMTGIVNVKTGANLALSGAGSLASASTLIVDGNFDISQTSAGASIVSLTGAGNVALGSQTLTLTSASGTLSGAISGTGGLIVSSGTETLSGNNTYTGGTSVGGGTLVIGDGGTNGWVLGNISTSGGTVAFARADAVTYTGVISGSGGMAQNGVGVLTFSAPQIYTGVTNISAGTLALGAGSNISASSSISATGTFDISATSGTSIKSLSGTGNVQLGGQTLTITSGSTTFSGVIAGAGGITVTGGVQTLSGINTYAGATTVAGGTLQLGGSLVTNNISNSGTIGFLSNSPITMLGVISGTGGVTKTGSGTATISAAQAYMGPTVITTGTLALSGSGSISGTSDVTANGTFDVSAATGTSIYTLDGNGTVQLGAQTLTLTNASGTFTGIIAGPGDLVLTSGKETLGGSSTMTGNIIISGANLYLTSTTAISTAARVTDNGVLDISSSGDAAFLSTAAIKSLTGSGSVVLGDRTLELTNAADTFAGVISGSGGLMISGGTQILSGANTYTGITTIKAGTLVLSSSGSLSATSSVVASGTFDISAAGGQVNVASLSGSGSVTLGGNNLGLTFASGNFSGIISGTGFLIVGGGTEILSGANNYTGGTQIVAGTLQIGNGSSTGSILGNVIDNGTLAFNRSDSIIFAGVISGSGGVAQQGAGTAILTGANTYSGGTVISGGRLQIGNGDASGSITGDVVDNGALVFNRTDAQSFAGTISGTGSVSQIGTGALTLTATSNYTGVTTIASGSTLALAGGASIASSSNVVANGLLDLTAVGAPSLASLGGTGGVLLGSRTLALTAGADTFSGSISGSGGLAVSGGSQVLSGVSSYTGATSVSGGTLTVNGSLAASSGVSVSGPGILAGTGTVPSVTVAGGGTLSPGTSGTGSLKVNGNLSLSGDSNFLVTQTASSFASISVAGSAALGGTLSVASASNTYTLGQKVAVLSAAGGISGSFATLAPIKSTGAEFKSAVTYDARNVYLEIDLARLSPLLPSTASINQAAPVRGIDAAIAAGDTVPVAIQNLGNLTSDALATGASQLSGEIAADVPRAVSGLVDPFADMLFDRLGDRGARRGLWASGLLGSDLVTGDTVIGSKKFRARVRGVAGGVDWQVSPGFTLGVALSIANSGFHVANDLGDGHADAIQAAVYGSKQFSRIVYGTFSGIVGVDKITTDRTVSISGTDLLIGKVDPIVGALRYETGLKLGWLTPYMAAADTLLVLPAYAETATSGASSFALNYEGHSTNTATLEMGVRQSISRQLDKSWTLIASDRLAWSHVLTQPTNVTAGFVSLPNSDFTVYGANPGRDGLLVSLGLALQNRQGLGFNIHFEGQGTNRSQTYSGIGGMSFNW